MFASCSRLCSGLGLGLIVSLMSCVVSQASDELSVSDVVSRAVQAAGGREKLLVLFRIEERYASGAVPPVPEKWSRRISVLEPPEYWWVDGRDRGSEPAKYDVWAWTLTMLLDSRTMQELQPRAMEGDRPTVVVRTSGSVKPAMDLHFDAETFRLVRLDWRDDIYRFSDWREHDGAGYHAKTAIWKKGANQPWFHHEVTKVERLQALPEGLKR